MQAVVQFHLFLSWLDHFTGSDSKTHCRKVSGIYHIRMTTTNCGQRELQGSCTPFFLHPVSCIWLDWTFFSERLQSLKGKERFILLRHSKSCKSGTHIVDYFTVNGADTFLHFPSFKVFVLNQRQRVHTTFTCRPKYLQVAYIFALVSTLPVDFLLCKEVLTRN